MPTWNDLGTGDSVTVRWKRTAAATESVVVGRLLPRTLAGGFRFESVGGRIFTYFLHDLSNRTPN
jgi:hypothetical protein